MGVLSNELSSWRKHLVECKAGIVNTLNFRDTRPNVMLVMNPSNAKIMCCLDSIPTEKNYDFMIKNHYARLVGRPTPTSQVYFLSDYDVTLQVYSIYDKNFDPSWLSDFSIDNVNLESETLQPILDALKAQSEITIAGVENGITLPMEDTKLITRLLSPNAMAGMINLKSIVDTIREYYMKITNNNTVTLHNINNNIYAIKGDGNTSLTSLYSILMTLTAGGNKGITNITGSGLDETSLKNVKDSITAIQGTSNATLSETINQLVLLRGADSTGNMYSLYSIVSAINTLNNTLLECKTLLNDIKTNTTPTTTP